MLSVENKNMAKNRNRSSFRRHFGEKTILGVFWAFLMPVAMGLGGQYLGLKVPLWSQSFGENFNVLA